MMQFKKSPFTIVEVVIAGVIISMAIYGFNMALGTSRRSVVVNKVKLAAETLAHDLAKRVSQMAYEDLDELEKSKQLPAGSIPYQAFIDRTDLDSTLKNYDFTPTVEGSYRVDCATVEDTVSKTGGNVTRQLAKKVLVEVQVRVAQAGISNITITEQAYVYVYDLR